MGGHEGSSAGSYLADPTSPIPSNCAVTILFKNVPVHQLSWLVRIMNGYESIKGLLSSSLKGKVCVGCHKKVMMSGGCLGNWNWNVVMEKMFIMIVFQC